MASGRRRRRRLRRRRLRGALSGEPRPLRSHPRRGGEEGAGASLGPARVTCPKHAHVMRAPRPSRRAHARRLRFLSPRRQLLSRLLAVRPPPAAWCRTLPTRSGRLGPPPLTLSEGLLQPANQGPRCASVGCHSAVTHQSRVCWPRVPSCQSTCQSAGRALHAFVRMFVGSFIRLANIPRSQLLLRPDSVPSPLGPSRIRHTCLHVINQQIFTGCQLCINSFCWVSAL